jgi:NCS1 family nucleobase:cation symporter-1
MSVTSPRRVLTIETRGIEPVPDHERHGRPVGLFWMWFGANMGILGITLGAILVTFSGLNVAQSLLVALIGAAFSFLLVGLLSVAGKRGGAPGLTLSRAVFGVRGNAGPTLVSWLGFVGWETVLCTTAAFALMALLDLAGVPGGTATTVVSVLVIVVLAATIGLFGHATIMWLQKWLTWIFGGLTLVVLGFLITHVDWAAAFGTAGAPLSHVVAGVALIAAGTGLGWLSAGADYARYLPHTASSRGIVTATVAGSTIPLVVLIVMGASMAVGDPKLASAGDPVAAIGGALPHWMLVPYLLTAVAGLIAGADLSMYSSGLNLITGGIPVRRTTAVAIDATLITLGGLYITVIARDFYGPFTTFLSLLAIPLVAWGAVFLVDMSVRGRYDETALLDRTASSAYWYSAGLRVPALAAWLLGILSGLAFANAATSGWEYHGWFADSWLGQNGMSWLVAGLVATVLALVGRPAAVPAVVVPQGQPT